MAQIRLPPSGIKAIEEIGKLDDATFEKVKSSLSSLPFNIDMDALANYLATKLGSTFFSTDEFIGNIIAMNVARAQKSISVTDFMRHVADAFLEMTQKALDKNTGDRLSSLMGMESLQSLARARELQMEGEKLLVDTRIISDVRNVFDSKCENVVGAVIVHSLKVEYHQDGLHKEMFLTLDIDDLANLKEAITRAETKDKKLREMIKGTGVNHYA